MFEFITESMIKRLETEKVFCWNTETPEVTKIKKGKHATYRVDKFMTKIYYPANPYRDYGITVYVHFIEYKVKEIIEAEKLKINSLEDYLEVYQRVVDKYNFGTEAERFYKNWKRRKGFENARLTGKIGTRRSKRNG